MGMRHYDIAVVGSGGMGALFGSILFEKGLDVVLIDINHEHVKAIQTRGLQIEGFGGDRTLNIPVVSDPQQITSANILLFQCKAYSTQEAAISVRDLIKPDSVCISFQNGLGNEEILGEVLGPGKVLGGLTAMAGRLLGPGRIQDFSRIPSYIGEIEGGLSERVAGISEKFTQAGLETRASANIKTEIWKKLLGNIALSALSGLTNLTSAKAFSVPELKEVSLAAMNEGFEVAEACAIKLNHEAVVTGIEMISETGGTGDNKSSLCVDLLNQRPTEVDFIYGSVIRLGEENGVPTPTMKVLHALVTGIEKTGFQTTS